MDRDYFEGIYADGPDPWGFETSEYERRKYDLTLAALPRRRYARALEPGCSIGVLTADLARRCDAVEAWEPIDAPRAAAGLSRLNANAAPRHSAPSASQNSSTPTLKPRYIASAK